MECNNHIQTIGPVCRWKVFCLAQDGDRTDFYYILGDLSLKEDLLIYVIFDPCYFSLDNTFKWYICTHANIKWQYAQVFVQEEPHNDRLARKRSETLAKNHKQSSLAQAYSYKSWALRLESLSREREQYSGNRLTGTTVRHNCQA